MASESLKTEAFAKIGVKGLEAAPAEPMAAPAGSVLAGHKPVAFEAVGGGAGGQDGIRKNGPKGGPSMPGGELLGHKDVAASGHASKGNSPMRSKPHNTQPGDIDKLKTAGA